MNKLSSRGFYEVPFCEVLDLIQEKSFLETEPYSSSDFSANPNWGGNDRSGGDLGGSGSSHVGL